MNPLGLGIGIAFDHGAVRDTVRV